MLFRPSNGISIVLWHLGVIKEKRLSEKRDNQVKLTHMLRFEGFLSKNGTPVRVTIPRHVLSIKCISFFFGYVEIIEFIYLLV